jgi:hypothetical protein
MVMKRFATQFIVLLCLLVFCAIAVIFRILPLPQLPVSFIGAVFGAAIAGVITVVLLEGQSRAEEIKERNVKVFEQKSKAFQLYIEHLWKIWEDRKVTAEEFQKLTSDYYSKLMIYLNNDSIGKISDCLAKIGDRIDREDFEEYIVIRDSIIEIVNTLSGEINLGGQINRGKMEELDGKVFPIIFKKKIIAELETALTEEEELFCEPRLECLPHDQLEYLSFPFRERSDCKVIIGPFNKVGKIKVGLHIPYKYKFFDAYRGQTHYNRFPYLIPANNNGKELFLNDMIANDEVEDNIEIAAFGFNDPNTLTQFRGNFHKAAFLLAHRAVYYLELPTVSASGQKFSICEFTKKVFESDRNIQKAFELLHGYIAGNFKTVSEISDIWGRKGIEIGYDTKDERTFGQWFFIGVYYRKTEHQINFIDNVPEIAIFFDINPKFKANLTEDKDFCAIVEKLKEKGFENGIKGETVNKWRLLYKRKPFYEFADLTGIDAVSIETKLRSFFETALKEIGEVGLDKHRYFEELFLKS